MAQTEEESRIYKTWQKHRSFTVYLGSFYFFFLGYEYTSISVSALFYFNEDIPNNNPNFYYGLTMSSMYLSAILANLILGRYMDSSRKLRQIIMVTLTVCAIGNLLYSLHFSCWFPIIGRFLAGFSDSIMAVITGELRRSFGDKELAKVLTNYQLSHSIGLAIGPVTPIIFQGTDFRIGSWHVNQNNAIGILNACVLAVVLPISYFGLINLTLHPGYDVFRKVGNYRRWDTEQEIHSSGKDKYDEKKMLTLRSIVTNSNVMIVIQSFSFISLLSATIELNTNSLSLYHFRWSLLKLSKVVLVAILSYTFLFTVFKNRFLNTLASFYIGFLCCFSIFAGLLLALLLPQLTTYFTDEKTRQIIFIGTLTSLKFAAILTCDTGARRLVFHLVPDHSASFVDGVRTTVSRINLSIGYFLSAYLYSASAYLFVFPVYALFTIGCYGLVFSRYKVFV